MPYFTENVVYKSDIAQSVQDLYRAVLNDAPLLEKEENLFFLLDQILRSMRPIFESADVLRRTGLNPESVPIHGGAFCRKRDAG